jgi:hypothetical protein
MAPPLPFNQTLGVNLACRLDNDQVLTAWGRPKIEGLFSAGREPAEASPLDQIACAIGDRNLSFSKTLQSNYFNHITSRYEIDANV